MNQWFSLKLGISLAFLSFDFIVVISSVFSSSPSLPAPLFVPIFAVPLSQNFNKNSSQCFMCATRFYSTFSCKLLMKNANWYCFSFEISSSEITTTTTSKYTAAVAAAAAFTCFCLVRSKQYANWERMGVYVCVREYVYVSAFVCECWHFSSDPDKWKKKKNYQMVSQWNWS